MKQLYVKNNILFNINFIIGNELSYYLIFNKKDVSKQTQDFFQQNNSITSNDSFTIKSVTSSCCSQSNYAVIDCEIPRDSYINLASSLLKE